MAVRDFVLLKQRDLDLLRVRAEPALRAWQRQWCDTPSMQILCCEAHGAPQSSGYWLRYAATEESHEVVWCHLPSNFEHQVQDALFDTTNAAASGERHRESALAAGVVQDAVNDLLATVLAGLTGGAALAEPSRDASPPDMLFRRYSGFALTCIVVGTAMLSVYLPISYLPRMPRQAQQTAPAALTPLTSALHDIPVSLFADLGEVAIPIGQLASLAVGDVLQLPLRLDQLLTVRTAEHRPICNAHLGQADGHRVLEMIKRPSPI